MPKDLAAAIEAGRVLGSIASHQYLGGCFNLEGLKKGCLLTKVAIECGVGIFTKAKSLKISS